MSNSEKPAVNREEPATFSDIERLKRDIFRPDIEKLQLFTKMRRTHKLLKRVIVHHK
ncbi:MAG TPA: hypothetical protein VHC47_07290 [Mucilaginibacter sp.]|nr:hypothetical protein [Mucilaginibacter sp.]